MAIPVDVTPILQACQSQEAAVRQQGEAKLRELETNAALYFQALSGHISNQASPVDTRMLAGTANMMNSVVTNAEHLNGKIMLDRVSW